MRLLICLMLLTANVLAYQGKVVPDSEGMLEIRAGESFQGIIRLWPYKGKNYDKLWALTGTHLTPHLYVHKIKSVRISENNNEVLEIYARIILKNDFGITSFVIANIMGKKVPLTIRNIKVIEGEVSAKKMHILNQDVESIIGKVVVKSFSYGLIILAVVGVLFIYSTRESRKLKRAQRKQLQSWKDQFVKSQTRLEIEEIYMRRREWAKFTDRDIKELSLLMESNQYKKEWNESELGAARSIIHAMARDLRGASEV